jgi:predicted O-methyltransferase YrrM
MSLFGKKKSNAEPVIPGNPKDDKRLSAIYSPYKQPGAASEYLLNLGVKAAERSRSIDLKDISARISNGQVDYIDIYPGEHYRLLSAIVDIIKPKLLIELGTHLGYSSLCMKKFLPADGKIVTFDIIPWNRFDDTILKAADFDQQMEQSTDDVTDPATFRKYEDLFSGADIVFMDALKDGIQEYQFLDNFSKMKFSKKCLFIFDDVRLWNMLDIWYNMSKPKLDMTSFGHWSGTGLVEWN